MSLTPYSHPTDERYEEERGERKAAKRRSERSGRDEYEDDGLEDWERTEPRQRLMLEGPGSSSAGTSTLSGSAEGQTDFIRDSRERRRERERDREGDGYSMSGGLGRREERREYD